MSGANSAALSTSDVKPAETDADWFPENAK
jgi:hypothetical protein